MIKIFKRKFRTLYNLMFNKYIGQIYMLHRVCPFENGKLSYNENMKVSPEFLERFILDKIDHFEFLSLDQLLDVIKKIYNPAKPFIVFTIDDGYVDNYNYAYPVFKKYNIPFTIYITPGFIDRISFLWWYQLEDLVLEFNSVQLSNGLIFNCETIIDKETSFLKIREIILDLPTTDFDNQIRTLFSYYSLNFEHYTNELMLNWDQIIEMSMNPLCTIAAHSMTHRRLSELNNTELKKEISESKQVIENKINKNVSHFAYPFGTSFEVNDQVVDVLKHSTFHSASFSNGGAIRRQFKDLYCLTRTMLYERKPE